MKKVDLQEVFEGRRVLVTGHTGFKGSWLAAWLSHLGAQVIGVALAPEENEDGLFRVADIESVCKEHHLIDIRNGEAVANIVAKSQPEIVFHLAAQALVRRSYADPVETFSTNVLGTVNVMEAARKTSSVRSLVCVTTDKVYQNNEWFWPYRENDRLGGKDAYSASKAAAELVASVYMDALAPDDRQYCAATARGGNVIGGGDWAEDRIVPDIIRAIRSESPLVLRNPGAIRPWQHVLELCNGYLVLAARLYSGWAERTAPSESFVGAWNFGPNPEHELSVGNLVNLMLDVWGKYDQSQEVVPSELHEATHLRLDSSKSISMLGWRTQLSPVETVQWTAEWYKEYLDGNRSARDIMFSQITKFEMRLDDAGNV